MALRHALLAALLDGPASGYELTQRFDAGVANFWHATKPQLYNELTRLESEGLISGTEVVQRDRPNKRVMEITNDGVAELEQFAANDSKPAAIKSDLLIKVRSVDAISAEAVIPNLHQELERVSTKLDNFLAMEERMLKGRTHDEYIKTARRVGPYLTLRMGIARERQTLAWISEVLEAIDQRTESRDDTNTDTTKN